MLRGKASESMHPPRVSRRSGRATSGHIPGSPVLPRFDHRAGQRIQRATHCPGACTSFTNRASRRPANPSWRSSGGRRRRQFDLPIAAPNVAATVADERVGEVRADEVPDVHEDVDPALTPGDDAVRFPVDPCQLL